jgi:hypothetical protein
LHAQWTGNVCTVTFQNGYCYRNKGNNNNNGGNNSELCHFTDIPSPINVKCGSTISRADISEPAGSYVGSKGTYYFSRWSTEPNP